MRKNDSPRPFKVPCFHCGQKRYTGWVIERGGFRIPVCSDFITRMFAGMFGVPPYTAVPNKITRMRFQGVWWKLSKEEGGR